MNDGLFVMYTWYDVERELLLDKKNWPDEWIDIVVFSTELIVYVENINEIARQKTQDYLKGLFTGYYNNYEICINATNTNIMVCFENLEEDNCREKQPFPLFKDFLYVDQEIATPLTELEGIPVTAFHSYKGGVGRTLSLISFVREIIKEYGSSKKVLIIDSDMEAPGLTWLGNQQGGNYQISYIDVLSVIAAKGDSADVIENISRTIENSTLTLWTEKMEVPQYFLPTYRNEEQLMDIYANPERIMAGEKNKYIIVDVLSKIGKLLKADMVLVDLRAGISEYSSPFLFDTRVNKYIVTSPSYQSVCGTNLLLKQMGKQKGNGITNILLTMVMRESFTGKYKEEVYRMLLQEDKMNETDDVERDIKQVDSIIEIEKNDSLMQLGSLYQICEKLNSAGNITESFHRIVIDLFQEPDQNEAKYSNQEVKRFRENLNKIALNNVTAENPDIADMLTTKPVMQLGSFTRDIPKINILGAKGSGKTYLYKQLVAAKRWETFLELIGKKSEMKEEIVICPVLCTEDRANIQHILTECLNHYEDKLPMIKKDFHRLSANEKEIRKAVQKEYDDTDWQKFWDRFILDMFENVNSWEELNEYLKKAGKKVIFMLDGLETIFMNVTKNNTERRGINALCKGLINRLYESQAENIGLIVFMRKDLAELALEVNFEQFRNQYQQYELRWSQKDALQLAWQLAKRAADLSDLDITVENIPINNASRQVIESNLAKIWGKKMGPDSSKTAFTVRWVLASLSDFNGQLQARDIVRFLKFATQGDGGGESSINRSFFIPG